GGFASAKSLETIISSLMITSTNNSALGKDLKPYSTDLNRGQNHQEIVAQED
ncbi:39628_t:CDS:2, partial [Gigaspora margarita]